MGFGWFAWGIAMAQQTDDLASSATPSDAPPIEASVFDAPSIEGVDVVDALGERVATEAQTSASKGWAGQETIAPRSSTLLGDLLPLVPGPAQDGSPTADGPSAWDEPERVVILDGVVWMTRAEITRRQWSAVHPFFSVGDCPECPVADVSWSEAMQFARAVGQREGRHYRLPTEAEWAAAAHSGRESRYPAGDDASDAGWTRENSGEAPHPVCTRPPNAGGFCDLAGNVMEWTLDAYVHRPAGGLDAWMSPNVSRPTRVVRGGSFRLGLREARVGWRMGYLPDVVFDDLGFRLVLDADPPPEAARPEASPTPPQRPRRNGASPR